MSVIVEFTNVGRGKKSWTQELDDVDHDSLLSSVLKHGALMSRDIEFAEDPDSNLGKVIVGGFRVVGSFRLLPKGATK